MTLPSASSKPVKRSLGFTLLEVLAALSIVAISLAALFTALSQGTRLSARVEERMVGNWVASNYLTEFRAHTSWPAPGEEQASVHMADRDWYVDRQISTTGEDFIRRIEITVSADQKGEERVASLYGYIFKPGPRLSEDEQALFDNF